MDIARALAILCRTEDMRTKAVFAALSFLETRAKEQWPFHQFRKALANPGMENVEPEGRWQVLNASLNGIKRLVR
jgi:hypothetical protein